MKDILKGLNREQIEAVTTTQGPLLIIAGAGTGKTMVIARRIAYIIAKRLAKPAEILALTFTDKAAQEMEERVDILVPYGYVDCWISTFHSFGDRIIRENALELGLSPDFRILTRPEQVLFFQQNLFRFDLNYYRPLSNPTRFIQAIVTLISRSKDEDVSPKEYLAFAKKIKDKEEKERQLELAKAYQQYEELKTQAGLLDFGDQIVKTLELFRKHPKVLLEYQNKFKYILVDEYQDTNYAQNEIVKLLAQKHKNICVTGDDDQSIYKFRGAAISNILEFVKNFPKAKQVILTQNYRSTQAVLDSAYKLIKNNNPDRLEVRNKILKKLKSQNKEYGPIPQVMYGATLSEETDLVAQEIDRLKKEREYQYKDFAILVRANNDAVPFIHALNLLAIPSKFSGSQGLYDREEIRLLISFLRSISNFSDSLNLYNLAISDLYLLDITDCIKCMDYASRKNKSLYFVFENISRLAEDLNVSKDSLATIQKIIDDIKKFAELSRKEKVGRVLYQYLEHTGYLKRLEREQTPQSETKIANIAKFFEKISEFGHLAQEESTRNFTEYLEFMRNAGEDPATAEVDSDIDAVNVMTIHQAKGLEFKVVFLVNLVAERFPTRERGDPIPLPESLIKEILPVGDYHMQEERRLFYVGMTRGQDLVYLTFGRDYGGKRQRKVSLFVLEAFDKPDIKFEVVKSSPFEKIKQIALAKIPQQQFLFEPKVIRLNQQQIDDYLTCPLKYKYATILRIPVLKHHAIIYGYALHKAVEEFFRQKQVGKILPLENVLEIFENAWESEGFLSAEHEEKRFEQGKLTLKSFWEREKDSKDTPTFIEKPFRFAINDVSVGGRWDRVDVKKDFARIIDFKSSENIDEKKAESRAKESVQLRVYALGYKKIYGRLPDSVGLYFLENGTVGEYRPDEKASTKAEEEIKIVEEGVRSGNFEAQPSYFACSLCPFNRICPFTATKI
jgi:DNA helicase-2/ATP-dependent DNA helicase PcrA